MPRTKMERVLLDPEKFFAKLGKEKMGAAWSYLFYWAMMPAIVALIAIGFMGVQMGGYVQMPMWLGELLLDGAGLFGMALGVATGISVYVGVILGVVAASVVAHAAARIFRGKGKFEDTLKAMIYGASPFYAFGWLPIFGALFAVYSVVVQVHAFKALHKARFANSMMMVLGSMFLVGVLAGILPFLGGVFASAYHFGIAISAVEAVVLMLV